MFRIFLLLIGLSLALSGVPVAHAAGALALGYEPKYQEGFKHFDYVNPDAPRGGHLTLSALGNFSSLNPFLLRGTGAAGLDPLVFETLMVSSLDEPFSQYGLLAEDAELAEDGLSVTYRLNPEARFSDGSPVTAEDVKFSFDTLKSSQAHPQYRIYWSDIERAVVLGERILRFEFVRVNPELHMIAGQIPIFSERWVGDRSFDEVVLDEPVASGPYRVESYDLGKSITYRRNPDYWADNLSVRRGMFNFERVTFRYYRDSTVQLEAFKAGEFDFNLVNNSKQWARDYVGSKFENGPIQKTTFEHQNNAGMQGFAFNLRRSIFQDKRVRRAITLAFDFEWANRNLFYDQYERCDSYFSNSELAATGVPSGDELALLEPYRDQLSPEVFAGEWEPPSVEPHGLRQNLIEAQRLLNEAGWHYRDGALRNADGRPFRIEFMLFQKGFLRIAAPFARNLAKLGIEMRYRTVDAALYERRAKSFDFDMMVASFGQSQSPGNELIGTFHSQSADQEGSRNLMGIQDPVVDALVEKVVFAPDRDALVTAVHALDRVLLNGEYLVPNWYIAEHRVAFRKWLAHPDTLPLYYNATDWALETWWLPEQQKETGS
ncbi:extracellular solute-binding protein [Thiohalomonas denitrificans]|uniref:Microcin C transport system substrate-binding protein n=1 Tax=Thiohalomonas denitrificans TaxID=415747 RepID=A0A1G5QPC7_9GAMM|nr:extracellular solute-binding protein [Thiohalomonas denitrificans]SCZ63587.1 microcin C transport system substrate-binding protein [Thiohalomonas denitrificans]